MTRLTYCANCGHSVDENGRFCTECGKPVRHFFCRCDLFILPCRIRGFWTGPCVLPEVRETTSGCSARSVTVPRIVRRTWAMFQRFLYCTVGISLLPESRILRRMPGESSSSTKCCSNECLYKSPDAWTCFTSWGQRLSRLMQPPRVLESSRCDLIFRPALRE
jgi:hypothetical protein